MNIVGVGIDLANIDTMRNEIENNPHFINDVFTSKEREWCESYHDPSERYSSRFAVKEALFKALPQLIQNQIGWLDIEIITGNNGKPEVVPSNKCGSLLKQIGVKNIFISISHEGGLAVGLIILSG